MYARVQDYNYVPDPWSDCKEDQDDTNAPIPRGLKPGSNLPEASQLLDCAQLVLVWEPVQDSRGYEIELQTPNKGVWEEVGKWAASSPSFEASEYVESSSIYRWSVRARDAAGNMSKPSCPLYFTCNP